MHLSVYNTTKGFLLGERIEVAGTLWTRLVGLLDRRQLNEGEGLLLLPCRAVHTCFMRFEIDVAFLDQHGRVVHAVPRLRPFRFAVAGVEAYAALELPAGVLERSQTAVGDTVFLLASVGLSTSSDYICQWGRKELTLPCLSLIAHLRLPFSRVPLSCSRHWLDLCRGERTSFMTFSAGRGCAGPPRKSEMSSA